MAVGVVGHCVAIITVYTARVLNVKKYIKFVTK